MMEYVAYMLELMYFVCIPIYRSSHSANLAEGTVTTLSVFVSLRNVLCDFLGTCGHFFFHKRMDQSAKKEVKLRYNRIVRRNEQCILVRRDL